MTQNSIDDFFRAKKAKSTTIDWEKRKQDWIDAIESLYKTITNQYLARSISDGLVTVSYLDKKIHEEHIGTYIVRELVLGVDDERAVFSPKGRNIVGGTGRIDLRGEAGEKTLIAQPGRWTILMTRTPTLKLIPLDETSLLQALKDVMGQ